MKDSMDEPATPSTLVSSRAALAALDITRHALAVLQEGQRSGCWVLAPGAPPAPDPLQGLYVESRSPGHHWARLWDGIRGRPEWFGAQTGDHGQPGANLAALKACVALCPTTALAPGSYLIDDVWWINTAHRLIEGVTNAIEDGVGTQIVQVRPDKDVIRIGGESAHALANLIFVRRIGAAWQGHLTPPAPGREIDAPKAFDIRFNLAGDFEYLFALDPIVGHYFYGNVNTKSRYYGCTRTTARGGSNDVLIGVWVRGTPAIWAGGNASLYLEKGNVTVVGGIRSALFQPTGILADGDFADLYVDGLETSSVAFPIRLNGKGSTYAGGHGDVHIRHVVCDQIIGDGITISNTNPLAKIHIDGGYIQLVQSATGFNKGLRLENGAGFLTVDNLQITGGDDNVNTMGVWVHAYPDVVLSETCIVESVAYPVIVEAGVGGRIACTIGDGVARRGAGTRPAVSLYGCAQMHVAPGLRGRAGAWVCGVMLHGTDNDRIAIDPTRIDARACLHGAKVAINDRAIARPGYYSPAGGPADAGEGIFVTGITT
jgi:hypothetical protein